MFVIDRMSAPRLGLSSLDGSLGEEERSLQEAAHRFAAEIMRPIGRTLDRMAPPEVVAPSSPLWGYLDQMKQAGLLDLGLLAAMSPEQKARIVPLVFEELGWGDRGLTILSLATAFPAFAAYCSGDPELIERFGSIPGCWVGTQPDRGSDVVDLNTTEIYPGSRHGRGNLFA